MREDKATKIILHPELSEIDLADDKLSGFFSDGRGYVQVTTEMVSKIISGELVITEYHETPLGNVVYLSAVSKNN